MKITICGSITNAKKICEVKASLEKIGHYVYSHELMQKYADEDLSIKEAVTNNHAKVKSENDTIKWYYNAIKNSDAVLVCNFEKNNIAGYIGGSVLIEIGHAHVLDKKIFFVNPIPECSYKVELVAMSPMIINGDLSLIK